jgi:hypothetical protein
MITWNYRVFQEEDGDFVIREVFYDDSGAIVACTANAVEPFGSSLEELAQSIEDFKAALELPVLTINDIPKPAKSPRPTTTHTISHEELRTRLGLTNQAPVTPQR